MATIPCPVGKCKGRVSEAGNGYQCDKDKRHMWLGDGQPRYRFEIVGEVEVIPARNAPPGKHTNPHTRRTQ